MIASKKSSIPMRLISASINGRVAFENISILTPYRCRQVRTGRASLKKGDPGSISADKSIHAEILQVEVSQPVIELIPPDGMLAFFGIGIPAATPRIFKIQAIILSQCLRYPFIPNPVHEGMFSQRTIKIIRDGLFFEYGDFLTWLALNSKDYRIMARQGTRSCSSPRSPQPVSYQRAPFRCQRWRSLRTWHPGVCG